MVVETEKFLPRVSEIHMDNDLASAISEDELKEIKWAYDHLEHPSLGARLSAVLATPIEEGIKILPKTWQSNLDKIAQVSISQVLKVNLASELTPVPARSRFWTHKFMAAGIGAVGGFFGPLTLLAELPIVTILILRAIADVARAEGEDLSSPEARMACAQVFAFGGRTKDDNAADLGYYGLRATLCLHFERDILEFAAGSSGPHIPVTIDFVRSIAARFGVVISDRVAARMVPIAGSATGATLNLIFVNHYQSVARGHFILRRLERRHGAEPVREAYQRFANIESRDQDSAFASVHGWR